MKSFNTKSQAEAFRRSLNKPEIHSVKKSSKPKRYNFNNDIIVSEYTGDSSSTFMINTDLDSGIAVGGIGGGGFGGGGSISPSPPVSPNPDPIPPVVPPTTNPDPGGTGNGGGTVGTQPGGTTYPTNPLPTQPPASTIPPNLDVNTPKEDLIQPTNADIAASVEAADMGETAMDDFWDEYGTAVAIGAGAAAAGGLAFDLTRDEDKSFLRRLFSASKSKADSVFGEYSSSIRSNKDRMAELLRRDFARNGPLYQAWQSGDLSLSLNRDEWVAFGKRYNETNFPRKKWPGFATIREETKIFLVNEETGKVFRESEVNKKVKNSEWVLDKSKVSTKEIIHVIDEAGEKLTVKRFKRGQKIPSLGNTPENILAGRDYVEEVVVAKDDNRDTAKELRAARNERARLEAQLKELEARKNRTVDPLKAIELEMERLERQAESDRLQKERQQKREEERLEREQEEKERKEKALIEAQQRLGMSLRDNDVDDNRYALDKEWVSRFVASGLGGAVSSDDIASFEYDRDKSGEVLVINYKDGSLPERWPRSLLIEMNGIPISYGPRFSPLWDSKRGITASPPEWASSIRKNPTTSLVGASPMAKSSTTSDLRKLFARPKNPAIKAHINRTVRPYRRNIGDRVYQGQRWIYNDKRYAKSMANHIRRISNGKVGVRTIPTSKGYRNYISVGKRR